MGLLVLKIAYIERLKFFKYSLCWRLWLMKSGTFLPFEELLSFLQPFCFSTFFIIVLHFANHVIHISIIMSLLDVFTCSRACFFACLRSCWAYVLAWHALVLAYLRAQVLACLRFYLFKFYLCFTYSKNQALASA